MSTWAAPTCPGELRASIRVPGSKSATNRALILACLADGPSGITGALDARDTRLMMTGLRALGHELAVEPGKAEGNVDVHVTPHFMSGDARIDVGLAGTVMRFLPPVATLAHGTIEFDGDEHARVRPMATVIESLRDLGANIDDRSNLPFAIKGRGELRGGEVTVDASRSSQFISGLLLSAARFDSGVTIHHVGPPVPSAPHIRMTEQMLLAHGVRVHSQDDQIWHVDPTEIRVHDWRIEPDLSNAAPFLAAAMVCGGSMHIPGWPASTTQAGDAARQHLVAMGASIVVDGDGLTLTSSGDVHGIEANLSEIGELTPTLAALAAVASGPSHFRGIGHLRHHETDRLEALRAELTKVGCSVEVTDDGLVIEPGPLQACTFATYQDHRMATAGAIIGLKTPGLLVENIETTSKTLPNFPAMWSTILGQVS